MCQIIIESDVIFLSPNPNNENKWGDKEKKIRNSYLMKSGIFR